MNKTEQSNSITDRWTVKKSLRESLKVLAGGGVVAGLIVLILSVLFSGQKATETSLFNLQSRIASLEAKSETDMAQWNSLKQYDERLFKLEISIGVAEKLIDAFLQLSKTAPIIPITHREEEDDVALEASETLRPEMQTLNDLRKSIKNIKKKNAETTEDFKMHQERKWRINVQQSRPNAPPTLQKE